MINFVFDSIEDNVYLNFTDCTDINDSGISRFTASPLVIEIEQNIKNSIQYTILTKIPKKSRYVIPTGVAHSPDFWTGKFDITPSKKTIFELLKDQYKEDLKRKRAYLMLDQSHEGYHELWLWDWFHEECEKHNISPTQIIYVTGNLKSSEQYEFWANDNNIKKRLKIIPYAHFEMAISKMMSDNTPTRKSHIKYKKARKNEIKLYNCLQKRPRNHRAWLFKGLCDNDLLSQGINSMNIFQKNYSHMDGRDITHTEYQNLIQHLPILPPRDNNLFEFSSGDCGSYLTNLNEQTMLDSWLTIVSEASFSDSLNTCFLSEKTFKPIACEHPFIIYGDKDSLKYLRSLGYKTFHPYINESYDSLPTWERLEAIIEEIKRLSQYTDDEKLSWYKEISPILTHNKKVLIQRKNILAESANILRRI